MIRILYKKLRSKHFIGCYVTDRIYERMRGIAYDYEIWKKDIDRCGRLKTGDNNAKYVGGAEWIYCKDLSKQFVVENSTAIMREGSELLLHFPGDSSYPPSTRYGKLIVGKNTYIGPGAHINVYSTVNIGDNCLFGPHVSIRDCNHGTDLEKYDNYVDAPFDIRPVQIDDGCWLGANVQVNAGVHIGRRCIIGTSAVVTKDIPDYCMAAGVPARVIKKWDFDSHCWVKV